MPWFQSRILGETSIQLKLHFLPNSPRPSPNPTNLVSRFLLLILSSLCCFADKRHSEKELGNAKRLKCFESVSHGEVPC